MTQKALYHEKRPKTYGKYPCFVVWVDIGLVFIMCRVLVMRCRAFQYVGLLVIFRVLYRAFHTVRN